MMADRQQARETSDGVTSPPPAASPPQFLARENSYRPPPPTNTPANSYVAEPDPPSGSDMRFVESYARTSKHSDESPEPKDDQSEDKDDGDSPKAKKAWYPGKLIKKRVRKALDRSVKPHKLEETQVCLHDGQ